MNEFSMAERAIHKIGEKARPFLAPIRRLRLRRTDFTIISNNCWSGVCYEYFGLPKQSPTVGMYFFADEYIHFLEDIRGYLSKELKIIAASESRYKTVLERKGQMDVPIGLLGDVEIVLLHYRDESVAKEKWNRRIDRINWDNIIYKFSYMNNCEKAHIHKFEEICGAGGGGGGGGMVKHFEFVPFAFPEYPKAYVITPGADGQIQNDTFYWNKYFDVVSFLNS